MPKINTTNFDLALRASHSMDRPFEKRVFGDFDAPGIMGAPMHLAFEAAQYSYVGSPLHLGIWVKDESGFWEPYVTLTKNVRPNDCRDDEIIVKTYQESAHLRHPLLELGYFEDTGRRIPAGFAELEIWRLTDKFVKAFDVSHPEESTV